MRATIPCFTAKRLATMQVALLALLLALASIATAKVPARGTYAFTNVNIVPMDTRRVVEDQTVIVDAARIAAISAAAAINVPEGATRIDGRGKYLMPGLGIVLSKALLR